MEFQFEGRSWDDLKNEIERLNNVATYTDKVVRDLQSKRQQVAAIITPYIEAGAIDDEYDIEQLVELLDLDIEKEVEIDMLVRFTGTVKVPFNAQPDSSDVYIRDVNYCDNSVMGLDYDVEDISFSE